MHLVGGWIGTLCIGFFSTSGTNALAQRRHPVRRWGQVRWLEPAAAPVHGGWSRDDLLVRRYFIIAKAIGLFFKTRVSEDEELQGLDLAIHGESAYDFGPIGGVGAGDYVPAQAGQQREGGCMKLITASHQAVQAR